MPEGGSIREREMEIGEDDDDLQMRMRMGTEKCGRGWRSPYPSAVRARISRSQLTLDDLRMSTEYRVWGWR